MDDLNAWLESHDRFPGTARLRRAIELAEPATESEMETRLRLLLVLAGLPRPQAQVRLHDDAGRFIARPDLYYSHLPAWHRVRRLDAPGNHDGRQPPPESCDQCRAQVAAIQRGGRPVVPGIRRSRGS